MQTSIAQQAGDFSVEEVIEHIARMCTHRPRSVASAADRPPFRQLEVLLQHRHRFASARRVHQFLFATSCNASISSSWSATSRFNRPVSCFSSRSRFASVTVIPPY
jgi:hypothetical protein